MPTAVALTHVPTNHPVSIGARKNNRQKAGHQSTNGSPAQQGEPPPSGPHYRHRCRTPHITIKAVPSCVAKPFTVADGIGSRLTANPGPKRAEEATPSNN